VLDRGVLQGIPQKNDFNNDQKKRKTCLGQTGRQKSEKGESPKEKNYGAAKNNRRLAEGCKRPSFSLREIEVESKKIKDLKGEQKREQIRSQHKRGGKKSASKRKKVDFFSRDGTEREQESYHFFKSRRGIRSLPVNLNDSDSLCEKKGCLFFYDLRRTKKKKRALIQGGPASSFYLHKMGIERGRTLSS